MSNPDDPRRSTGVHADIEEIAAYVDRTLSPARRAVLETHLLRCTDCRRVLADTADVVHAQPLPWRRPIIWASGGVAAVAMLVLAVQLTSGPHLPVQSGSTKINLDSLVDAFANESTRPAEGRLSGGFAYAPAPAVTRGANGPERSPEVRQAVAELAIAARDSRSPDALAMLGVGQLANAEINEAIASLEEAARDNASDAPLQSDLSAAYLARGRRSGAEADLQLALAAADRALALTADLPEALFNRALALDALKRVQASTAWHAVIDREPGSPWADEAARHLQPAR